MSLRDTFLSSVPYTASTEALLKTIRERYGDVPDAYRSIALSQVYLNDTSYNLRKTLADGLLDARTKHLIAVSAAAASHNAALTQAIAAEAHTAGLPHGLILEGLAVAASITTHNIFYKFQHLAGGSNGDYAGFKPAMKLMALTRPEELTPLQVELICAVVSVINDCSYCVRAHLAKSRDLNAEPGQIEEALRVGAVVAGMAVFASVE